MWFWAEVLFIVTKEYIHWHDKGYTHLHGRCIHWCVDAFLSSDLKRDEQRSVKPSAQAGHFRDPCIKVKYKCANMSTIWVNALERTEWHSTFRSAAWWNHLSYTVFSKAEPWVQFSLGPQPFCVGFEGLVHTWTVIGNVALSLKNVFSFVVPSS